MKEINLKKGKLESLLNSEENIDLTLSYSRLSDFDRNGPRALIEKTILENQGVKMGSLIDDLLFSPEEFKTKYYISKYNEPTTTLGTLAKIILENYRELPTIEEVFSIIEKNSFWKSTKNKELLQKNFDTEEFWGYIQDTFDRGDKMLITENEKLKAYDVMTIILNHEYSKHIFDPNKEHLYQHKFITKIRQFNYRGILDVISIDHENKTITFTDLKTGAGSANEFLSSFIKYRYYLQAGVYCSAFRDICIKLNLEGYALNPFEFLYIGLKEQIPVRYVVTNKWINASLNGFKTSSGYEYKGIYELTDDVYFHWKNKIFDLPRNIYENKGVSNIEDNFIS